MKRTDITELFPEATKEQVNAILNLNGADINSAKPPRSWFTAAWCLFEFTPGIPGGATRETALRGQI